MWPKKTNYINNITLNRIKEIIKSLINILNSTQNYDQSKFLHTILDDIDKNNVEKLSDKLNSVELWGGSGAVWEVNYNFDKELYNEFKNILIDLLNLLNSERIIGKHAKSAFKVLSKT